MRGKKEIQSVANSRNVAESVLPWIVRAIVVCYIRWGEWYHRGCCVRDRGGDFLHCMRLVRKLVGLSCVGVVYGKAKAQSGGIRLRTWSA